MAAQDLINTPPVLGPVDQTDSTGKPVKVGSSFATWFTQVYFACFSIYQSGTTAQRPTSNLWVGRSYFDVTLGAHGKPIWYDKTADGWVDAAGTIV